MDWYHSVFELIDLRSFSNLWYWIMLAIAWSTTSHWVLGVPFDMIGRARRHGGQAADDLQALVRINVNRMLYIVHVSGIWLLAFTFFLLTALVTLGFWYWIEFAQALFMIVAPMTLVGVLTLRTAHKAAALTEGGEPLYRLLNRHRLIVQVIGMVSIFVTSLWGMWQNLQLGGLGA